MNPLLKESKNFDGALDFDKIKPVHFIPALKHEIKESEQSIQKITSKTASFKNTIEALECSLSRIEIVTSTFFNLLNANTNDELVKITAEFSKLHTQFTSSIFLNQKLFNKVKQVHDKKEQLNEEESQLLKETFKGFTRNGAMLPSEKKEELLKIDIELSSLSPKFSDYVLKAMEEFKLHVTNPKDVEGLPESTLFEARKKAHNQKGWIFGLDMPTYTSFLKYCNNRQLRYKMWKAYSCLCTTGKYDTSKLIKRTIYLRHLRASLLGFKSHAEYVLQDRMAKTPGKVNEFMENLLKHSLPAAKADLKKLQTLFEKDFPNDKIKPWDVSYFQEKLKLLKFNFSDEDTRDYFEIDNAIKGMFGLAKKLYNLDFKKVDLPKYNDEVWTFKIYCDKQYMGLFYMDLFPRPNKKTGAWMTTYRTQGLENSTLVRPHVSIVCNFTKPTHIKPSLITFRECEIMFHEFGHALHAILSECTYKGLSGTNVKWDFVELPSQFMENWLMEQSVLDRFAKHYKTGKTLPQELFDKMKGVEKFMAGYNSVRQLNFSILDMAWHSGKIDISKIDELDIEDFEKKHSRMLLAHEEGTTRSNSFLHIFAGGYSAGYYSYKWAEVLDADAFEYFKENGLFNTEISESFKKNILSKGATQEPDVLYRRFRGRKPDIGALLRREGIDKPRI